MKLNLGGASTIAACPPQKSEDGRLLVMYYPRFKRQFGAKDIDIDDGFFNAPILSGSGINRSS